MRAEIHSILVFNITFLKLQNKTSVMHSAYANVLNENLELVQ